MPEELKPCPMCSKSVAVVTTSSEMFPELEDLGNAESWAIVCSAEQPNGPGGCGASGGFRPTEAEAIAAWNRRAPAQAWQQGYAQGLHRASKSAESTVLEPVAWRYQDVRGHYRYCGYKPGFDAEYAILKPVPLYLAATPPRAPDAAPAVEPEPVAWNPASTSLEFITETEDGVRFRNCAQMPAHAVRWCLATPPRTPLTDEQAEALIESSDGRWHEDEFRIDSRDLMALLRKAHGIAADRGQG